MRAGTLALLLALGAVGIPHHNASAAVNLAQCNGGDGAGSVIACDVTITNNLNLDLNTTSSSVVVVRHCAGVNVPCGETTGTTTNSTQLVTSVQQCNNAGNGGGSTLTCRVTVTNNIRGGATATPATVNQCNGSGDGLGAPKVTCNPFPASTTGADITQCNNSANGGTLVGLSCTVSPGSTHSPALPVTVNQCNGSDDGGGSTVICSVSISNLITPSTPTPTPNTTATRPPGQTGTTSGGPRAPTGGLTSGVPVPHTGGAPAGTAAGAALLLLGLSLLVATSRREQRSRRLRG
ncbi:MAG: hypothetical protein ABR598_01060 [Candidatus Dormibacteria bacterium]